MAEDHFRVRPDKKFRLEDHDPGFTGRFESKEDGKRHLEAGLEKLRDLPEKLYAQDQWAVLLIFQAMDAPGKDSVIEHGLSGGHPQGCRGDSFKAPSAEERRDWDEYMKAYEKMIEATTSDEAPWFVIPADHKWFTRLAVADVIVETLEELDLHFPEVSEAQRQELARARALLEGGPG